MADNRILLVEDDYSISDTVALNLRYVGYEVMVFGDGSTAAAYLAQDHSFDLALLDIMLPGIDGFELFAHAERYGIPVIYMTAKTDSESEVRGLRDGAEDYIVKPFEIVELLARVEVVLRRYKKTATVISFGDVTLDTVARMVTKGGHPVDMTVKEYNLLLLLVRNPGIALFRETLFDRVWGYDYIGETRTLDSHIQRLRRKLDWNKKIITVYKVGYRFDPHGGE